MAQDSTVGWPLLCTLICLPRSKNQEAYREVASFLSDSSRDRVGARPDFLFFSPISASQNIVELVEKRTNILEDARLFEKGGPTDWDDALYDRRSEMGGESFLDLEMRVRSFIVDMKAEAVGKSVVLLVEPIWARMFRRIALKQTLKMFYHYHDTTGIRPGHKAVYAPKLNHVELPLEERHWNAALT